jgi:MtN3 and saliva related transmembrane protein
MSTLAILASFAGIFMGLSSIPQLIKIYKLKSAKDISAVAHIIIVTGASIWMLYGIELGDFPIIASNLVGIVTNGMILYGCYKY